MSATSQKPRTESQRAGSQRAEPQRAEAIVETAPQAVPASWIGRPAGAGIYPLFAGAPFVAIAALPGLALGWDVAFTAFLLTACAAFTIHMPLVAIASGQLRVEGGAEDAEISLSPRWYFWLLLLWTATDLGLAAIWH